MASWQANALILYFRLRRLLRRKAQHDPHKARLELEALGAQWRPKLDLQRESVDADGVPAAWLLPPDRDAGRVLLYFHGGAYVAGSIESHLTLTSNLAKACRAQLLAVDYRLAPEDPFPAAVEDAVHACRWLLSQGWDPAHTVLAGDSAGGGLAVAAALALRDAGESLPAALVCISPWFDLSCSGKTWVTQAKRDYVLEREEIRQDAGMYLGGADPRTPLASPYFADLHGLPPILLQVGSDEVLRSDSTRLAERLRDAGVEVTLEVWDGMQHVWHFVAGFVPEADRAIQGIAAFIDRNLPGTQSR